MTSRSPHFATIAASGLLGGGDDAAGPEMRHFYWARDATFELGCDTTSG